MIFLIVLPARFEPASGSDEDAHGSAEPWTMVFPVAVLTVGAAIGGLWGQQIAAALNVQAPTHTLGSMLPAIGVVLGGIGLAWVDFGRGERAGFLSRLPALQTLFSNGWYIDTLYRAVFVRLTNWLATLLHGVEVKGLDGGFDQVGFGLLRSGDGSRSLQSGWVQFYGGCVVLVIGAIALYVGMGG
jgi:NADH-quinone oxidoreductase subunit L